MPRVRLYHKDDTYRDVLGLNLKSDFGINVEGHDNLDDLFKSLNHNACDLVIFELDNSQDQLLNFLGQIDESIPIAALNSKNISVDIPNGRSVTLFTEHSIEVLKYQIASQYKWQRANDFLEGHYPIPLKHFYYFERSFCDVYIRLSANKYVKRIHQNDNLTQSELGQYEEKGLTNFFIANENRKAFVENLTKELIQALGSPNSDQQKEQLALQTAAETVATNIEELGLTPDLVKLSNTSIAKLMKRSLGIPKLKKIIEWVRLNPDSLYFQHLQLTLYLSVQILEKMDWKNGGQQQLLSFLAFFRDISIPRDDLIQIRSKRALKACDLSEDDQKRVDMHANKAAELVKNYPQGPVGYESMIKHHHGSLNGIGFVDSYPSQLSPLSLIFILAEESAMYMLNCKLTGFTKDGLIGHLYEKMPGGRFRKHIDILGELF